MGTPVPCLVNLGRFRIHLEFLARLKARDRLGGLLNFTPGVEDGEVDGEPARLIGTELGHSTGLSFNASVVRKACAGFQAGNISFLRNREILPESDVRQ